MSKYQTIRGISYPNLPWFKRENIEKTMDYVPRNGDIIITSYPKTGTNWLQYIVLQIISKGESLPSFDDCLYNKVPFMEMAGPDAVDNMKGLRIYKHHYRYDMVKKNPKSKVLYIYRNPEDTLVSWYYFLQNIRDEELTFEELFESFLEGNIEFGSYYDHVLSYFAHRDDENLLLISYEKLHSNRSEEILRIARFLGEEFYQNLVSDETVLEKILEHTSFDYMRKNIVVTFPHSNPSTASEDGSGRAIDFFRKGAVGDGKKYLTLDQLERLHRRVEETLKGTEILKEWLHV